MFDGTHNRLNEPDRTQRIMDVALVRRNPPVGYGSLKRWPVSWTSPLLERGTTRR